MTFSPSTSKLFQSIMERAAAFFGLDQESVTETEIDNALDALPLAQQLEDARSEAIQSLKEQVETLSASVKDHGAQLQTLEDRAKAAEDQIEIKDARIVELQLEVDQTKTSIEKMAGQHKAEISNLSGQLAKARAGVDKDSEEEGADPLAKKDAVKTDEGMIVVSSKHLESLTAKRAN